MGEAIFHGPSPSPTRTSPNKNGGAFPSPPTSSEKKRAMSSDPWDSELDAEEPLSVRAKRLSTTFKDLKKMNIAEASDDTKAKKVEIESFKFVKSDSLDNTENTTKENAVADKRAALNELKAAAFKEIGFGTSKHEKEGEDEAMETSEADDKSANNDEETSKTVDNDCETTAS